MNSVVPKLSPFPEIVADFQAGKMVIIVDDDDRENEGDLVIATEKISAQAVNFMMQHGRGLICVSISGELARNLKLPLQTAHNNSPYNTQFTISIDHKDSAATGVTAAGRAQTLLKLIEPYARAEDFATPGHVFPLIANERGVVGRQGQTEGSYDLARIAGLFPSGVICEILNPDGSMARGAELNEFALLHNLKITSVAEILKQRLSADNLVRQVASSKMDTAHGYFDVHVFEDDVGGKEHLALVYGSDKVAQTDAPLVRLHSECLTGDVFESRRCDCGRQLDLALKRIVEEGSGALLYLRQEGRGIGLSNKLKAYELQDHGHDTVEANIKLGFKPDERDFAVAAQILSMLGVMKVRLLTNNPSKLTSLSNSGIEVCERLPLLVDEDEYSRAYLEAKRAKLGHLL